MHKTNADEKQKRPKKNGKNATFGGREKIRRIVDTSAEKKYKTKVKTSPAVEKIKS